MSRVPLLPLFTVAVVVAVALIVLLLLTASWWALAIAFGALLAMLALVFDVIRAHVNDQP